MPTTQSFRKLFSLKIVDFFAYDMSDQNSMLPAEFIFPKEIKTLLRNTNSSIEIRSSELAIFSNVTNYNLQTKSRNVFFSAFKTVVFLELHIPACVLLQTVISVQKKK